MLLFSLSVLVLDIITGIVPCSCSLLLLLLAVAGIIIVLVIARVHGLCSLFVVICSCSCY